MLRLRRTRRGRVPDRPSTASGAGPAQRLHPRPRPAGGAVGQRRATIARRRRLRCVRTGRLLDAPRSLPSRAAARLALAPAGSAPNLHCCDSSGLRRGGAATLRHLEHLQRPPAKPTPRRRSQQPPLRRKCGRRVGQHAPNPRLAARGGTPLRKALQSLQTLGCRPIAGPRCRPRRRSPPRRQWQIFGSEACVVRPKRGRRPKHGLASAASALFPLLARRSRAVRGVRGAHGRRSCSQRRSRCEWGDVHVVAAGVAAAFKAEPRPAPRRQQRRQRLARRVRGGLRVVGGVRSVSRPRACRLVRRSD